MVSTPQLYPLVIEQPHNSETLEFEIQSLGEANMKIWGIRVQDLTTLKWYEWDVDVGWSEPPMCVGGGKFYVAAYLKNIGNLNASAYVELWHGVIGGIIGVIAYKSETVPPGGTFGIEKTNITQPALGSRIRIIVTP